MQSREIHQLRTAPHNILINKVYKIQNNVTFKFSLCVRNLLKSNKDWLMYFLVCSPCYIKAESQIKYGIAYTCGREKKRVNKWIEEKHYVQIPVLDICASCVF